MYYHLSTIFFFNMFKLFYIYIFTQYYLHSANTSGFDYENTSKWWDHYPVCGGHFQSPINIRLGKLEKTGEIASLAWCGYDIQPIKLTLVNDGHTIVLKGIWPNNNIPYIEGGPLSDSYIFEGMHFHWGPNNSVGSEHRMNRHSFPLEMHMVHYKKKYRTYTNATNYRDGLAVVGIFFSIDSVGSHGLTRVLGGVPGVQVPGSKIDLDPFELSLFDVASVSVQFITYAGSLTTPPCSEIVIWILPVFMLKVTAKQMERFRLLQLNNNDTHNYRDIQPVYDRNVHILTQWSEFYMTEVYKVAINPMGK